MRTMWRWWQTTSCTRSRKTTRSKITKWSITPSIGIALYPEDGKDIDTLLKNADTAMYHAKEGGRNAYQFFNAQMNLHLVERTRLENDLKAALQNSGFFLEYQPIVDTQSGHMTGVEAFLRWNHPEFGILMPPRFLGVAEDTGLLTTAVLHQFRYLNYVNLTGS